MPPIKKRLTTVGYNPRIFSHVHLLTTRVFSRIARQLQPFIMSMASIHRRFAEQVAQHKDEQSLVDYLLDAAPIYGRVCLQDASVTDEDIKDHLGFSMSDDHESERTARRVITPYGCPCSKEAYVCVDTENASLVCTECGHVNRSGFVHSFHDLSCINATPTYRYQPKTYFAQHLNRLGGYDHPPFSTDLLENICFDLMVHGISLPDVNPNHVHATLKRLKLGKFYPHRWALTKRINPRYQPLVLPHQLRERLDCVFLGCYKRYASQRAKTGRKRKFLSYPLFIRHALHYLGLQDTDVHFQPLKNRTLAVKYARDIAHLLRGDPL